MPDLVQHYCPECVGETMFREDGTMMVGGELVNRWVCIECEPTNDSRGRNREIAREEDGSFLYLGRWKRT